MFSLANVPDLFADKLAGLRRRSLTGPLVPARALDRSQFWHELHHLYVPDVRRASRRSGTGVQRPKDPTFVQLSRPALRKFRAARMQRPHWAAIRMKLDDWSFLSKWRRKWQLDQKRGLAVATGMSAIETAEDRLQLGFGNANAVVTNSYGVDIRSAAVPYRFRLPSVSPILVTFRSHVAKSRSRFSRLLHSSSVDNILGPNCNVPSG
jgi:hypothetical protein